MASMPLVRLQGHCVGPVALEHLARVLLGSRPHVAALGVEDHGHARMRVVDVGDEPLERVFGARRGEVRDLRLEGAHQVGGRIDDRPAEREHRIAFVANRRGKAAGIGIEADAQQAVGGAPARAQGGEEVHGAGL